MIAYLAQNTKVSIDYKSLRQRMQENTVTLCFDFAAWRDNIFKRPSLVNTMSEAKYYEEIYGRYLRVSHQQALQAITKLDYRD